MRIDRLSPSQRVEGRWLVYLEDGELLRVGQNQIADFALYAGRELTAEELAALTQAARSAALSEKALGLLARRPMSRRELVDRLTRRPRDPAKAPAATAEEAQAAVDRLTELGYLDDGAYAGQVVRYYAARGYGLKKLRDELARRGVPREFWDEALEQAQTAGADALDEFLRRRLRDWDGDPKALKRAADALARRGYPWEEIRDALGRYERELERGPEGRVEE